MTVISFTFPGGKTFPLNEWRRQRLVKNLCFVLVWLLFSTKAVSAANMYINDVVNVSLRTGPGLDQEVIQMIKSGQELDIIENRKDWSMVRLPNGQDGWVLSRYLTTDQPNSYLLQVLEDKHRQLLAKTETVQQQYDTVALENNRLYTEIDTHKQQLMRLKQDYDALKEERNLHLFVIGAGILLLGFFIGYVTNKNRRRSSLLS